MRQDQQTSTAYLRLPREHWHRIRHSNFIERTCGETRRRTKVIGRLPGETSCVPLVWAVLDRASRGWRGFTITATGTRLLQDPAANSSTAHTDKPIRRHAKQIHEPAADAA
jgi:transposase-like protein